MFCDRSRNFAFFRVIDVVINNREACEHDLAISAFPFRVGRLLSEVIWTRSTEQDNLF